MKEEVETQTKNVRISVGKAFESAKSKGVEGLGEIAVWQALTSQQMEGTKPAPNARRREDALTLPPEVNVTTCEPTSILLSDVLRSVGLSDDLCTLYDAAIAVAVRCGLPIVVSGPGSWTVPV